MRLQCSAIRQCALFRSELHYQRPREKRAVLRERKEALSSPVNKEDRVKGESWFQSAGPTKEKDRVLAIATILKTTAIKLDLYNIIFGKALTPSLLSSCARYGCHAIFHYACVRIPSLTSVSVCNVVNQLDRD